MQVKSKVLISIMFLLLVGSIAYAYYHYIVMQDFDVIELESSE